MNKREHKILDVKKCLVDLTTTRNFVSNQQKKRIFNNNPFLFESVMEKAMFARLTDAKGLQYNNDYYKYSLLEKIKKEALEVGTGRILFAKKVIIILMGKW